MAAAIAMVIVAPFERALFAIPGWFAITTTEATIVLAIGVCVIAGVMRLPMWSNNPLVVPGGVLLAVLFVAAIAAPVERANAIRFSARMATASLAYLLFANAATTLSRARVLVRVLLAVATGVGTIALLEAAQVPGVMAALTTFRPGFHVVAGQLRATSTLFYPTIASMYLEVAFALGLWLLLDPSSTRPRVERLLTFAALTIVGAGIAATFTRAGLVGLGACLALVAGIRLVRLGRARAGLGTITSLAAALIGVVFLTHSPALLAARLTTEGSQDWYGARYEVPSTLSLETGATHMIPIAVTNTGRLTWDSDRNPRFTMSYHWLRANSVAVVQFEGDRTPFPSPVRPGARVTLPASVTAPGEPGTYTLLWDVAHETRAWLSTEGVQSAQTTVTVHGAKTSTVVTKMPRLPAVIARAARPDLWRAAVLIAAERPWLGIGPDNFRHAYGRYAGLEQWDTRVHANNMYLEVLTGAGVGGLLALVWLVGAAGLALWRRCRTVATAGLMPATVALAAWMMIAGHGLVDSFLSFTTTYVTFAMVAGLAFPRVEASDANRI